MTTIVLVNYNGGPLLRAVVSRLEGEAGLELVIVDNASTDGSLEGLDGHRLIRNDRNLGFAVACNQGARLATGEHVLFLNPDCMVEPGAIAEALGALETHPTAAMAGALIQNEDGTEQRGCRRAIPDPKRSLYRLSGLSRLFPNRFPDFNAVGSALPDGPVPVEAISGAFMLVRKDAFEALGGWDEGYFLHCEDLDLCRRFTDAGHDILFVPAARAVHLQGTSSRGRPIRVEWHKHQGMWRFYRKFQAPGNPGVFNGLVRLGIATHFVLKAVRLAPRSYRLALDAARAAR